MLSEYERSAYREHMLSTELQNSAMFKSYHISKFINLEGLVIKKDGKFEIWINLRKMHQLKQFLSDLAEISTKWPLYHG